MRTIEAEFDLVLISEYFNEFMMLPKEIWCWDLDDVVSFPLNKRDIIKSQLSKDSVKKLKSWNKLDWELYMHFNKTFSGEKIYLHIGKECIKQEVKVLQEKQIQLAKIYL